MYNIGAENIKQFLYFVDSLCKPCKLGYIYRYLTLML